MGKNWEEALDDRVFELIRIWARMGREPVDFMIRDEMELKER